MDKMQRLSETIRALMEGEFSGYIRINFTQGSLGRIEKSEEFEVTNFLAANTAVKLVSNEKEIGHEVRAKTAKKAMPPILIPVFLAALTIAGCAISGTHQAPTSNQAAAGAAIRRVQPGDSASVHYLCRLHSGEVAAATDAVAENIPRSNIYMKQETPGPRSITAMGVEEKKRVDATKEVPFMKKSNFEEELAYQLGHEIIGMKEGEKRSVELKSADPGPKDAERYFAHLNRVRIQPKLVVMEKHTYEYLTNQSPEIGQAYTYDRDFPGKVESISDKEVTVRLFVTPGIKETLFGPARIREEGDNYILEMDAHKGSLVFVGGQVGRVSFVDDKMFILDFGNPFGGETLLCDVSVEKIQGVNLVTSQSGTR